MLLSLAPALEFIGVRRAPALSASALSTSSLLARGVKSHAGRCFPPLLPSPFKGSSLGWRWMLACGAQMRRYSVIASLRGDYCFRFEVVHVLPLPLVPVHACMIPHLEGHTTTKRSSYDKSLWLCFDSFMPTSMLFLGVAHRRSMVVVRAF